MKELKEKIHDRIYQDACNSLVEEYRKFCFKPKDVPDHIINHPLVSKARLSFSPFNNTLLHQLAFFSFSRPKYVEIILWHPDFSKVRNNVGETPLHLLAFCGDENALRHPDVDKVRNVNGWVPLHWLCRMGVKKALEHPSATKVKDTVGKTPKDVYEPIFEEMKDNKRK